MANSARTVLITGASTGIGKAAALKFQAAGWNVAATMRTPEKATWVKADAKFITPVLDVTQTDSIRSAISQVRAAFGHIDTVVNNAGYGLVGPLEASSQEQVERQFSTNVFGLMNVCREIIPHFRERKQGTIINVASIGGRIAFPLYSLYHATKWAVEGFSESLQYELQPFGIRVKIIEPGPIKTDFYDRSMDLIEKPGLTAYDSYATRVLSNIEKAGATAPGPDIVAKVIYRAATDQSTRLRYAANGAAILGFRRVASDNLFRYVVRKAVQG